MLASGYTLAEVSDQLGITYVHLDSQVFVMMGGEA